MGDTPKPKGTSSFGFFLGFFAIIVLLALTVDTDGRTGVFSSTGTTSVSSRPTDSGSSSDLSYSKPSSEVKPTYTPPPRIPPPQPVLTPQQVEDRVAQIYRELDTLRKDVREATLREPVSPYAGKVDLSVGSVYETDPDRENLMLRTAYTTTESIPISLWYLESYVTEERATIPKGDRLMTTWRSPASEAIYLAPNETAYLITGESPIDTSFHENLCTGYLNDEETFYPTLYEQCPSPKQELERFGKIKLDNDECYDFVERMPSCQIPSDEQIDVADIGGICLRFVEDTFNYNDCVSLHREDPYFERNGTWRIYLDERNELWRPKREIIRLMDENDRVIDVIEY